MYDNKDYQKRSYHDEDIMEDCLRLHCSLQLKFQKKRGTFKLLLLPYRRKDQGQLESAKKCTRKSCSCVVRRGHKKTNVFIKHSIYMMHTVLPQL